MLPTGAPGNAPVSDPCGLAGGTWFAQTLGGDFNSTEWAKLGDKGSVVLPYRPTGTVWKRGGVATTRWQQTAAHGGGYRFRLCPKSEPLTEECFAKYPLAFANNSRPHRLDGGLFPRSVWTLSMTVSLRLPSVSNWRLLQMIFRQQHRASALRVKAFRLCHQRASLAEPISPTPPRMG